MPRAGHHPCWATMGVAHATIAGSPRHIASSSAIAVRLNLGDRAGRSVTTVVTGMGAPIRWVCVPTVHPSV